MKKKHLYITVFTLAFLWINLGCEEEVAMPNACIQGPASAKVDEMVTFTNCSSDAEFLSIWVGDSTHMYSLRNDTLMVDERGRLIDNQGRDMSGRTSYSYVYKKSGTYTVTLLATNTGNKGKAIKQSIAETQITITE